MSEDIRVNYDIEISNNDNNISHNYYLLLHNAGDIPIKVLAHKWIKTNNVPAQKVHLAQNQKTITLAPDACAVLPYTMICMDIPPDPSKRISDLIDGNKELYLYIDEVDHPIKATRVHYNEVEKLNLFKKKIIM